MDMIAGRCRVCGERFLNDTQLKWLKERVSDKRTLEHILSICPGCKGAGHGLVDR
jgi:hypothetical protein